MKKESLKFKEQRFAVHGKMKAIEEKAKKENRDFTEAEETEYKDLDDEYESLSAKILRAEKSEAREAALALENRTAEAATDTPPAPDNRRDAAPKGEAAEKRAMVEGYSFVRAIRSLVDGGGLDGVEKEANEEAKKEANTSGVEIRSGVSVPSFFMDMEKRGLDATVAATAANTIETSLGSLIPYLRPRLMVQEMGAQVLTGLQGNLDLPRNNAVGTAQWKGEKAQADATDPTFDLISLRPKRLTAYTEISDQLIRQSSIGIENFVRNDLQLAIATKLDSTALNGSGTAPEPRGILNTTGIGNVVGGANGDTPTWENVIALQACVAQQNADMGSLGYLMNPITRGQLQTTKKDAGSGMMVMESPSELAGYRAGVTTQVPNDGTKGTGTDLSTLIYGNWNDLIIGQWGGVNLIVDPYTLAREGCIRLVINSFWDLAIRHPESFAAMLDVETTIK